MSYKTELQNNNTRLRGVVDKINALPDYVEPSGNFSFSSRAGGVPGNGISAVSVLDFTSIVFTSSAEEGEA